MSPSNKLNDEKVAQRIEDKFGDRVTFLGGYVNSKTPLKMHCNVCGNDYEREMRSVMHNPVASCDVCYKGYFKKKRTKTTDQFKAEVKELVGDEYSVISEYKAALQNIKFRHNLCGTEYKARPNDFLNGNRCPKCGMESSIRSRSYSQEEFSRLIFEKTDGEYEFVEPYRGNMAKIKCCHNACGFIWEIRPNDIMNGHGCPRCNGGLEWNNQRLQDELAKRYGEDYTVLGVVVDAITKVDIRHNVCGNVWNVKPVSITLEQQCPYCHARSRGEQWIDGWLKDQGVNFNSQQVFDDCRDERCLPFDFYLPSYNLVIEYDGEQHYHPVKMFGGKESYEYTHRHDLIKNKYCEDNGINLLRIPYTVKGTEAIGKVIQEKLDSLAK